MIYKMEKPKKKQKKSKEQGYAEGYFPVDGDDLKYSVEKQKKDVPTTSYSTTEKKYKKLEPEQIEMVTKVGKKTTKKRVYKKTAKKKTTKKKATKKKVEYSPPKVTLKKSGYELIITEKPQAANKIAVSLDDKSRPKQLNYQKVPYYEVSHKGKNIVVACAVYIKPRCYWFKRSNI